MTTAEWDAIKDKTRTSKLATLRVYNQALAAEMARMPEASQQYQDRAREVVLNGQMIDFLEGR